MVVLEFVAFAVLSQPPVVPEPEPEPEPELEPEPDARAKQPWTYRGLQVQPTHFLEPTRVGYVPFLLPEAVVGADIAPHFFFLNTLASRYAEQLDDLGRGLEPSGRWAFTLSFTPRIHARLFKGNSSPVRTPSYIGHVDSQAFHTRVEVRGGVPRAIRLHGILFAFGHHSNGQDGCTKTNEIGTIGECTIDPDFPADQPVEWNTTNGDFSTNFFRLGYGYKHIHLSPFADAYRPTRFYDVTATVELNPYPTGAQTFLRPEIGDAYGPYRVSLAGSYSYLKLMPRLRTALLVTMALDMTLILPIPRPGQAIPNYRIVPELRLTLPAQGGVGVFVRGVLGQDDYNIHFVEPRYGVDVGLVVDLGTGDVVYRRLSGPSRPRPQATRS